jgi:hypothetical protein
VAVLVAHGLLLLNDGIYWDDWLLYPQLQRHDWPAIDALVREAGVAPINAAFLHLFGFAPGGVLSFKVAVFVLILAIAWLVYLIAIEAGFNRRAAWFTAALTMAFPGFQDWVLLSTAASVFDYALFLLATFTLLRAERASGGRRLALRLASLAGFALSFGFNSLLAMYLGSLLLLLLVLLRSTSIRDLVRSRWLYGLTLIALPIAYWEVSRRLYAPSGLYVGFNSFASRPSVVLSSTEMFVKNGIVLQMWQSLTATLQPWTWPMIAALVAALVLARRRMRDLSSPGRRVAIFGAGLGLASLGLAMLPYILVGKFPTLHGWDTRHDLLISLPLALLIVSVTTIALPAGQRAWIGTGLVGFLVIGFAAAGAQDYAALEARWAADRAAMAQLKTLGDGGYSVYWVAQGVPGPDGFYRFYEWSAMLGDVYGDQQRVGLDVREYDASFLAQSQFFNDRYDLAGFDPHGCQADLSIVQGGGASGTGETAMSYTWYRFLQPAKLEQYLGGLVTVRVVPRPSPEATSCAR